MHAFTLGAADDAERQRARWPGARDWKEQAKENDQSPRKDLRRLIREKERELEEINEYRVRSLETVGI